MLIKKVFSVCLLTLTALRATEAATAATTTETDLTTTTIPITPPPLSTTPITATTTTTTTTTSRALVTNEFNGRETTDAEQLTVGLLTASESITPETAKEDNNVKQASEEFNNHWDVLIFTQQWPPTTCYHWQRNNIKRKCRLPSNKELWSIHGIWPTRYAEIGPNYCNHSADFNVSALQSIRPQLNNYWPDIEGNDTETDNWLWKHEWLKHGTCAESLAQLSDELKYFRQALTWYQLFPIEKMLARAGIHPDSNNTIVSIHTAVTNSLHKNPSIHCLYDSKTNSSLLQEIRLCFDKQLTLIDCNNVKHDDAISIDYPGGSVITNCHISQPVLYPSVLPTRHYRQGNKSWQFPLVNLYKLIQFISWVTL